MADTQEAIRRLSIQTTETGTADATKKLNDLAAAQGGVAVASATTEKATLSLDQKFASIEKRYVAGVAAQAQYEKTQRLVNAAVAQNPALQDRANAVLAAAKDRHDQLTNSQKAMSVVSSDLNSRIQGSAGSFGVLGNALTALGPVGLGVAAVMGTVIAGFNIASDAAHGLADKAKELREFAEATGLTTQQVQALKSEAGKFGIDSETLSSGIQKFTTGFQQLRLGTGDLLTQIRRINPALADQIQGAQDAATAFTLFGQAVSQTDSIFQRNALLKAGMGKGSAIFGEFFQTGPDVAALTSAFAAAGKGIDDNLIKKLALLQVEIDKTRGAASTIFATIFAENVLTTEKEFASVLLDISKTLKLISEVKFPEAPDWVKTALGIAGKGALGSIPVIGPLIGAASAVRSAVSSGASVYDNRQVAKFPAGGDPMAASSYGGGTQFAGGGKGFDAQAADFRNYVSVLGSAATPTEKLTAAIADLKIKARDAGESGMAGLARGIAALNLDAAIAQQNVHNAALGAAASQTDLLAAKTLELKKAQEQGANLTTAQIANIKAVSQAQALGTYQIQSQIDAEKIRIATLSMGTEAATSYAASQSIINKAKQDGKPLSDTEIEQIKATADAYARIKTQADQYAETVNGLQSSASSTLVTGLADIADGTKSVSLGFQDMSKAIIRALEEAIIKITIVTPMIEALKQAAGGLGIGNLFGATGALNANGSISGAVGATSVGGAPLVGLHDGGIVGAEATFSRYVHPAHFNDAPRFHTGGIAGDEVPIIAKRGEGVFTTGQMAALGGGGGGSSAPNIIINNHTDAQPQVSTGSNGDVTITLKKMVDGAVGDSLSSGTGMRVLSKQYGVNQFAGQ